MARQQSLPNAAGQCGKGLPHQISLGIIGQKGSPPPGKQGTPHRVTMAESEPINERPLPQVAEHQLIRCIGFGSGGEVWLARNSLGTYRAVKIIRRSSFPWPKPYEDEFQGLLRFEPLSRQHDALVDILQVGGN